MIYDATCAICGAKVTDPAGWANHNHTIATSTATQWPPPAVLLRDTAEDRNRFYDAVREAMFDMQRTQKEVADAILAALAAGSAEPDAPKGRGSDGGGAEPRTLKLGRMNHAVVDIDDLGVWLDGVPVFGDEAAAIRDRFQWQPHTAIHAEPIRDQRPSDASRGQIRGQPTPEPNERSTK